MNDKNKNMNIMMFNTFMKLFLIIFRNNKYSSYETYRESGNKQF